MKDNDKKMGIVPNRHSSSGYTNNKIGDLLTDARATNY